MSSSISSNLPNLNTQRNLLRANDALATSHARLSIGVRVNTTQDLSGVLASSREAASRADALSSTRGMRDAVDAAQTLDAGLSQAANVLGRMHTIATQSLDSVMSAVDRDALNAEFTQLKSEALRIAGGTSYGGQNLLALNSGEPETITIGNAQLDRSKVALTSSGNPDDGILTRSYGGLSLASSEAFNISGASTTQQRMDVLKALDSMISDVSTARYAAGTLQSDAVSKASTTPAATDPGLYSPARPATPDIDFAAELENLRNRALKGSTAETLLSQINNAPQMALNLLRG